MTPAHKVRGAGNAFDLRQGYRSRARHAAQMTIVHRPMTSLPRTFAALAVVAAAVLLLRPVCELWLAHLGAAPGGTMVVAPLESHGGGGVQCCASASDPNLTAPLQAASGGLPASLEFAVAVFIVAAVLRAALAAKVHSLRAPPPAPSSFYLRSTRILR